MIVGERLREMRVKHEMSQGDVEHKTGLLRCYISRVEHGHTVPGVDTLQKLCSAMDEPLWRLFYDGEDTPPRQGPSQQPIQLAEVPVDFMKVLPKLSVLDRDLLLHMAITMARKNGA